MIAEILLSIGILLAIALILLVITQIRYSANVTQIWKTLQLGTPSLERFDQKMIANQPEPVQRYFLHAIAPGTVLTNSVQLSMSGSIRLSPTQNWLPLQAEEILSTQGFVWKATAAQGILQMRGADYYARGSGRTRFTLWGLIPVVDAYSPDTGRSAIGRLIGEYFWLPSVLLPQWGVSWQALDEQTIQAHLTFEGEPVTLTLGIDHQGRLLTMSLLRWGDQTADRHFEYLPFGGDFEAEQTFAGYTIPVQFGAGWQFGSDRYFEFFRVTVEQARFHS